MKCRKYGINGVVERTITIKVGKNGLVRIPFKGGGMDSAMITPATYRTTNKVLMALIELHPLYKNGVIECIEECEVPDEDPNSHEKVQEKANNVKTWQEAKSFLIAEGAELEELQSKSKVMEYIKEKGYIFPNLK